MPMHPIPRVRICQDSPLFGGLGGNAGWSCLQGSMVRPGRMTRICRAPRKLWWGILPFLPASPTKRSPPTSRQTLPPGAACHSS